MNSNIRDGAIVLALLASVGIASAQNAPMAPAGTSPTAKAQDSMGKTSNLQLSAAQKTAIFQSVTKDKVKSPPPANLQVSVGAQIPASIELYPLPANVVADVPAANPFKYTVSQNQVVIVDPTNMKVVEVIKQ
jgi:Protein of unknown function (DUF1236)